MRKPSRFRKLTKKYNFAKRRKLLRLKNHPFVVPVVTLFVLLAITMVAFIGFGSQTLAPGDSHVVILSHDKKKESLPTKASTVGDLLDRLNIKLNPGDVVEPSKNTAIVEDNFRVNVYRAQPVTIVDGGKEKFAISAATTPRSISKQAGITVYPEDDIKIQIPDTILRNSTIGQEIIIDRATPVFMNLYGTAVTVRTRANTVADLLKDKNVKLGPKDTVKPSLNTKLTENLQVFVTRKGTKLITVKEEIAAPTQVVEDASLSFGTEAIRQQGSKGERLVTYQIELKNGKEISRKKIQVVTAKPPVTQIIARGKAIYIPADKSQIMAQAGIPKSDYAYVNYIISRESGWCPTKLQGQIGYCPAYAPDYVPLGLGYGLGQATPGTKMSTAGGDWKTNPVTQLRWCTGYASRYGGWSGAYNFWLSHGWW